MMVRAPIVMALLLAACGAAAADGRASDDAIAAIAMPEPQLRAFLPRVVFRTQTMAMGAYNLGIAENCAIVRPAFEAAVARHLPAWRANLVKAYRDNVPSAMLAKAAGEDVAAASATLRPYLDMIGGQMQTASTDLLKAAAGDVLKPVMDAATNVDPKSVDGARRKQDMAAAIADGSLFCGLGGNGAK
jgi:hypothetical protein